MPDRDLYQVLGVNRTASADEIKSAFRKAARKHHPDVNPNNKGAEEKFKEASAAFDVLGTPEKRKLYDEFGADAAKLGFDPEKAKAYRAYANQQSRQGAGYGGGFQGFGGEGTEVPFDLSDLFGEVFSRGGAPGGRGQRARRGPARGEDIEAEIAIDLGEAMRGGERTLSIERPAGAESTKATLVVTIPKGAHSGTVIRLAGQGGAGQRGGPAGDVLLTLTLRPHPWIRLEGRDLSLDLPVTIGEALRGAEVNLPTFEGDVKLRIPPGSSSGRKLRLKGKGLPDLKGAARGDLYAVLQVAVPTEKSDQIEKLAEEIDKLYSGDVRAQLRL